MGRKPIIWTATGHDYENLRVGMQDPVPGTNALSDPGRGIRDGGVGVRRGHGGAGASEGLGDGPANSLVAAGNKRILPRSDISVTGSSP